MTDVNTQLGNLAAAPATGQTRRATSNWFEAFASAWGSALDNQASKIEARADQLTEGSDTPSQITMLTADSMRMSFMSQSSHTSLDSVSKALETMARKN
ncbi:hypothetical protein [Qipengyuania qiaonensis]|uniref:Type III secretion protein n=1 Tax=Qipengyuania qiaonensis TaxID=2867240 RepID=A0ABS7J5Z4_9SPHN|nr:hypothetical protein [Qipengyuania qiaonensis]MBX7482754.1 hypothetical protein [Qipengyuania qiaonensis]